MHIDNYDVRTDDNTNYVRFIFSQSADIPIASVGMALCNHETSMDCSLTTPDECTIRFHRAVLASRSGYFDKLLFSDFQESKTDTIAVQGSASAWQCIRTLLYKQMTGTKNKDTLIEALETAYHYDFGVFVTHLWDVLGPMLDGFIAVRSLRLAGLHQNKDMGIESMRFIKAQISTLICDCEWVHQYASVLQEIGGMPQEFI